VTNNSNSIILGGDDGVKIADQAKVSNAGVIEGGVRGINFGLASGGIGEISTAARLRAGPSE